VEYAKKATSKDGDFKWKQMNPRCPAVSAYPLTPGENQQLALKFQLHSSEKRIAFLSFYVLLVLRSNGIVYPLSSFNLSYRGTYIQRVKRKSTFSSSKSGTHLNETCVVLGPDTPGESLAITLSPMITCGDTRNQK
jgi:hypothetical protein